jgi:hypothetical protein
MSSSSRRSEGSVNSSPHTAGSLLDTNGHCRKPAKDPAGRARAHIAGEVGALFVSAVRNGHSSGNAASMPGFPLARGSVWAGGRASGYTPSQVPPRGGATSCRETPPLTYSGYTPSQVPPRGGATSCRGTAPLTYLPTEPIETTNIETRLKFPLAFYSQVWLAAPWAPPV